MTIDSLSEQVAFAHERIERLANETNALQLLVKALIKSHPNPDRLIRSIETEREIFLAIGGPKNVSDELLKCVHKVAGQAISDALYPSRSAKNVPPNPYD